MNFAKFRANICFFYIKIETCPSRQFVISAVRPILHKKCHLLRTCIKCNAKKTLASLTSWYIAVLHNMNLSFLERKTGFCSVRQVGEFMNYCWVFWRWIALYSSKANREVNSLGRINGKQEAHINFQLYIMFRYMFWWINRVAKESRHKEQKEGESVK